ncbi:MAG TPA: radical SAM protein [Pyrinomonadaceae bacterium]|nr:radical SAM protein [Pyrinomonadaceae bacterium]
MRYIQNPPNPYLKYSSEFLGEPSATKLEIYEETNTKKIITKAFSADFGHRYTVNCYRGCIHACTYCFARQYHEYLGYGAGTDFETKIVVKPNAPTLLRNELKKTRDKMNHLDFSFATDPYLPLEASYELTRKCLEICAEFRVPVGIITKSPLVTRDLDILKKLDVTVFFSIPFSTTEKSKPFELYTPIPDVRFRAMKILTENGIKCGIGIAPIILGYNDSDIPVLLQKARDSGATKAFMSLIHFDTDSIENYFVQRLREKLPTKTDKILNHIRRERDGNLRHKNYHERNSGKTEEWKTAVRLFELNFKRLGFERVQKSEAIEKVLPLQQKLF